MEEQIKDMHIRLIHFRRTWLDLESEGWCDSEGSMEFWRVLASWLAMNRPDASPFIKENANSPVGRESRLSRLSPDEDTLIV